MCSLHTVMPDGHTPLSSEMLTELSSFSSATIANAIETFHVRPRGEGFTNHQIRCLFPDLGAVVAYACTMTIASATPAPSPRGVCRTDYWDYVHNAMRPKIVVAQDLSDIPGGAYWGEVNSNIHLALGADGVLTNGTVRDIVEVERLGFHLFSSGVSVSHGFAHLEDFGKPVSVFGMRVQPGDLIHADRHGAVVIPHRIAASVAKAAREIESAERVMISLCQSSDFATEKLDKLISPDY